MLHLIGGVRNSASPAPEQHKEPPTSDEDRAAADPEHTSSPEMPPGSHSDKELAAW